MEKVIIAEKPGVIADHWSLDDHRMIYSHLKGYCKWNFGIKLWK